VLKATILEEMPPFPERESSILAKLKKKRPDKVANNTIEPRASNAPGTNDSDVTQPTSAVSYVYSVFVCAAQILYIRVTSSNANNNDNNKNNNTKFIKWRWLNGSSRKQMSFKSGFLLPLH